MKRLTGIQMSTPVARRLEQVREIAGAVNATSDLPAILQQIVFSACHHASWWTGGIMALNRSSGYSELVTRYQPEGVDSETLPRRWSLETSPSRLAVERRQPVIIPDAQVTTEYQSYRRDALARDYRTVVIMSLNVSDAEGRDLVLAVHSKHKVEVGKEEIDFLSTISHLAAIAVNKAKLVNAERAYSARLKGVLDLSSALFERVLEGGRMDAIVPLIEATFLHPLAVVDFTTDQVHSGRAPDSFPATNRQWAELLQAKGVAPLRNLIRAASPSDFSTVYAVEVEGLAAIDVHVESIRIDHETVGGLVVFPTDAGLSDLDILVAQNAKFALSTLLIRSHVASRQLFAQVSDLLERAIDGTSVHEPAFRARAAQLGWSFAKGASLLVIEMPPGRDYQKESEIGPIKSIERDVKRIHPAIMVGAARDKILVSIPNDDDIVENDHLKRILLSTIEKTLKWETGNIPTIVEGPFVKSIADLPNAFRSCLRILTLARMFSRRGLINEKDFGPYALLISALDDDAIPGFVAQTVGAIKAYDLKHGTEFLRTSAVFIDQNCRFEATASELKIHVSTLRYRIKRIAKVFGIDMSNTETRFALALAIRLEEIQHGKT